MTYTEEEAKQKLGELVARFRTNIDVYKRSAYKEAQVRCEFIDPFFEALGWDVSNRQGFAEQYKEVVLEDTIKVGSPQEHLITASESGASVNSSWKRRNRP